MSSPASVTVGIDGSASALTALDWAVDYALARTLPLRLVTAVDAPAPVRTRYSMVELRHEAEQESQQVVDRALESARAAAPELDVTAVVSGEPPIPTLLLASRTSLLLVVGCRGLSPIQEVFLGSVSTSVSAHAHCSGSATNRRPPCSTWGAPQG
jgi:nucleotide-binding universal stress UspA family protein